MGRVELDEAALQRVAISARLDALWKAGALVVFYAQLLAPVGFTGHLRRSIERGMVEGDAEAIWVVATAAYSIFVERGTGRYAVGGMGRKTPWVYYSARLGRFIWTDGSRPQPFMNRALDMAASDGLG